ncbi:Putative scavenger mRNA decapping enzyme DcpS/DCS2, HIT-like superfamily [Septoria linicola]|uniref:Scavenger mRNA decapping enzyme DcpS/DCS2, HIT-like superfamily n=1 Tax=Septoria linicola TaxID=215465 RepID=A0A9Q9B268_9PEZI|nr:Putative scavenger mRNA decapping enzyme DcpS/DCS2, HIT-like superfamily [Septoria linicola]
MSSDTSSNSLLTRFKFTNLLNTDQQGRRIILQGTISSSPALLLCERAAFATQDSYLSSLPRLLSHVQNLGENDIYRWYMANSMSENSADEPTPPDLKINLIYPATEKHFRKYAFQQARVVIETPEIYEKYVRKYMSLCREEGRLNWVFNIIEGRSEQENVLYRSQESEKRDDFLLLPDLNWDRKTIGSLHLLALVERRDVWSVRDLKKRDVEWLRRLRGTLTAATAKLYPEVESDMLKFYVHYQPTYYHFHVHVVHVNLDATGTQAVGKALGLDHVISQLDNLKGGEEAGMHQVELSYTVGESSELWQQIYLPLKEGREPTVGG